MTPLSEYAENLLLREAFSCFSAAGGWQRFFEIVDSALNCRSLAVEFDASGLPTGRYCEQVTAEQLSISLQRATSDHKISALEYLLQLATPHRAYHLSGNHLSVAEYQPQDQHSATDLEQEIEHSHWPAVVGILRTNSHATIVVALCFPAKNAPSPPFSETTKAFQKILQVIELGMDVVNEFQQARNEAEAYKRIAQEAAVPCVLIDGKHRIVADLKTGLETLAALGAATSRDSKLVFQNQTLEHEVHNTFTAPTKPTTSKNAEPPLSGLKHTEVQSNSGVFLRDKSGDLRRVSVQRVDHSAADEPAWVLIRILHQAQIHDSVEHLLQTEFGLSVSEAHLAYQLAATGSVSETIEQLNITRNTLKTHLRSIFDKTGARTQLQLAHMVYKLSGLT